MASPLADASPGRAPRLPPALPPLAYERLPGEASRPLPRKYRRREPDRTALHTVVRSHLQTFLEEGHRRFDSGTPTGFTDVTRSPIPVPGASFMVDSSYALHYTFHDAIINQGYGPTRGFS